MVKLSKQYYRLMDGSKKVNCYHLTISKSVLEKANINENAELSIKTKHKKIIIEEVKNKKEQ